MHGILWIKNGDCVLYVKNSVSIFVEKYMICSQWVVVVLASYILGWPVAEGRRPLKRDLWNNQ
jgi:hypothetical protein